MRCKMPQHASRTPDAPKRKLMVSIDIPESFAISLSKLTSPQECAPMVANADFSPRKYTYVTAGLSSCGKPKSGPLNMSLSAPAVSVQPTKIPIELQEIKREIAAT